MPFCPQKYYTTRNSYFDLNRNLGNQLGDSVDDVIDKMASYGKKDILAPFEENEEPDSEEEDEPVDDDEEEEGAEVVVSRDTCGDDLALEIKGFGLSPDSKQLKDDALIAVCLRRYIYCLFIFNL